jgi:hypothetical protein
VLDTKSPKYLEMAQRHISLSGAAGPAGPKGGRGRARGGPAGTAHGGGEGGGWASAKGEGRLGQKERKGGEKKRFFFFLFSIFSYMPNSSIHPTTNRRVHNPA